MPAEVGRRARAAIPRTMLGAQIRGDDRREHWRYVDECSMERFDVPPLPEGDARPGGRARLDRRRARRRSRSRSRTRSSLLVNALGPPPKDVVDQAHEHGVKVAALVGKRRARASATCNNGVDIIVAQGYEAGGHTGEIATMVLVPEVVDAVAPVPVLAAGGIGSGRQIAAAHGARRAGRVDRLDLAHRRRERHRRRRASRSCSPRRRPTPCGRGATPASRRASCAPRGPTRGSAPDVARARCRCRCSTSSPPTPTRAIARSHNRELIGIARRPDRRPHERGAHRRDVMFDMVEEYIDITQRLASDLDS